MAAKTREEHIALIDEKITKKKNEIAALEAQKHKLLHPVSMREVMSRVKQAGFTPEEVAEKLGISLDD